MRSTKFAYTESPKPPPSPHSAIVQQTFMNAFDLYIQSVKIQYKGLFYIQWKRGKKVIQTLKHESDGKIAVIKQNLTLNITLTFRNSRAIEKNTVLSILNAQQQQIDHITLPIHKWTSQYSSLQSPLAKGLLKAKVRKRQLMQIRPRIGVNSPSSYLNSDQEQYSSYLQQQINVRLMVSQTKANRTQIDTIRDQTSKLRKQLQDTLYVNNKLKNDRSVLMTRNLELETELSNLKTEIKSQIQGLEKYYKNKIEIRQSIYEDEINLMITAFNNNSQNNLGLMKQIIQENQIMEKQVKVYKLQVLSLSQELHGYQQKLLQVEKQKQKLKLSISEYANKSDMQKISNSNKFNLLESQLSKYKKQIQQYELTISELTSQIKHFQVNYQKSNSNSINLQKLKLELQKQIQSLRYQLEENKNQLQFTEQAYKKQKQNNSANQQTYRDHIKKLEDIIKTFEDQERRLLQDSQEKAIRQQNVQRQNETLKKQIFRLRGEVETEHKQIQRLQIVIQQLKQQNQSKISQLSANVEKYKFEAENAIKQKQKQKQIKVQAQLNQSNQLNQMLMQKTRLLHEKTQMVENLSTELQKIKQQLQANNKKIKQMDEKNQKLSEQLQFITENGVNIEQHEQLQQKVVDLQNKLNQYELNYQNVQFPSFEKEPTHEVQLPKKMKNANSKNSNNSNNLVQDYQNISFQAKNSKSFDERVRHLQEQLKGSYHKIQHLNQQNEELKRRFNELTMKLADSHAQELQLRKKLQLANVQQMKIVQYCSSQDQENRKLEEQQSQIMIQNKSHKSRSMTKSNKNYRQQDIDEIHSRQKDRRKPINRNNSDKKQVSESDGVQKYFKRIKQQKTISAKVKKASSMQIDKLAQKKNSIKEQKDADSQIIEQSQQNFKKKQQHETSLEAENNKARKDGKDQASSKKLLTFRVNYQQQNQKDKKIHRKSEGGYHDQVNQDLKRSQLSKFSKGQKTSKINIELADSHKIGTSNKQGISSNKSNSNELINENYSNQNQNQNRSRQSFISGTTMYKFQKISHREKMKRIQKQNEQLRMHLDQYQQKQIKLLQQINNSNSKLQILQKELKLIQQDRHSLKASLHFQLQKRNVVKQNRGSQTDQKQKFSKSTQANIILQDPQKLSLNQDLKKSNKFSSQLQQQIKKLQNKQKQVQYELKTASMKLQQSQRKYQEFGLRYQQKCQQIQKLKKEAKALQQKDNENKNIFHSLRLQKNQFQFNINRLQTENKKLKTHVEDLQQKIKKNDIGDQLRQLQFQVENGNKKILQQNRSIYQLKLQKDTADDEMKILRKKNSQIIKKSTQLEYSIQSLQKSLQEQKRKQGKHRRQLEDRQDTIEKQKDQIKRLNEQISSLKGLNNEQMFERKKYIDEISALQSQNQRKQYELINQKKQLQKLRYKLQQKQQQKGQYKSQLRRQQQALESELSSRNKEILQLESTIKQLSNKLEFLSNQNKRAINEKSVVYSDKLKVYIEEIAEIKKLLDDNTMENNGLKYRLKQTEQQLDSIRSQFGKVEEKLAQEMNNTKQLTFLIQNEYSNNEKSRQRIQQLENQCFNLKNLIKTLKMELENEEKEHHSKKEQNDSLLKTNDQQSEQINRYKIKISDYETQLEINKNYNEKLGQIQKQLKATMKQLKQNKKAFQQYKIKYIHSAAQMESAMRQLQNKWREKYQQMQDKLTQQCQNAASTNKKQLESEVVQLLSEISQLRTQSQKKSQFISQLQFKLSKLEILPLKVSQLQKMLAEKIQQHSRYKIIQENNRQLRNKVEKLQQSLSLGDSSKAQIASQLVEYKSRNKSMQQTITQYQIGLQNSQLQNNRLSKEKSYLEQQQHIYKSEIQKLLALNRTLQDEKNMLMQKSEENRKQHNTKIARLEDKLQEMSSTIGEHQQALSQHYEKNLQEIKLEMQKMYYELQNKDKIIVENQQIIGKLEFQLQSTKKQIGSLKNKEANDAQMFQMQFNSIKNKMNDNEKMYRNTINNLQIEIQEMSKQMTKIKLRNMSQSQIPLRQDMHNSNAALNLSRLQDKIRQKDSKLQQFKQNIFVLEQTIIKYKKKQGLFNQTMQKISKLQKQNTDYQTQIKKLDQDLKRIQSKQANTIQSLKQQISNLKNTNDKLKLNAQQKQMEMQSSKYELQTMKELYGQLQRQLEKRKVNLKEKLESQSKFNQEMQRKVQSIVELEERIEEMGARLKQMQEEIVRKSSTIQLLEEKITVYEKTQSKFKNLPKINSQGQHYKNQIRRLSEQNEQLHKSCKKLREEVQNLEKDNYETRTKLSLNQSSLDSLNTTLQQISIRCKQFEQSVKKFQDLNEACYSIFHVSLDQAIFQGHIAHKLEEKNIEISNLMQEVEQLKFLNERKLMDYDQLKKQNYEFQLKLQDVQFVEQQVEELRQICDKLQQQKKDAVIREQILKVQVQSLLSNSSNQTRERLEKFRIEEMLRRISLSNGASSVNRVSFS